MWFKMNRNFLEDTIEGLRVLIDEEHVKRTEEHARLEAHIKIVTAERDEAYELLTQAHENVEKSKAIATEYRERNTYTTQALERDARDIGQMIAERTSAVGMIAMCRQLIESRSATSARVAGALIEGYSVAKDHVAKLEELAKPVTVKRQAKVKAKADDRVTVPQPTVDTVEIPVVPDE